jgi:Centromere/kinetochore Zw10.
MNFLRLGFLATSDQSILEYARNVDILFANKTCQILLGRAREIMKKDLHEMMEVGPIVSLIVINISVCFSGQFSLLLFSHAQQF